MVVPCKYLSTRSFSFGLAAVTEDGHKWFYIDYKGNKVCGDYAAVGNFRSDGMAFVKFDGSSNIGYFINPQGEIYLYVKSMNIKFITCEDIMAIRNKESG